jgi:hypothetical protein
MTNPKTVKRLRVQVPEFGGFLVRHRNFLVFFFGALGILLRSWNLADPVLFRDEAESAINALTILEHGVPTDRYLSLPIYENTLTRPWPDSVEYEFRDTSYSDRGFAVYHGWLPLYAMAASFVIFDIVPDKAMDPPRVRHDNVHMRRRTLAARAPSVVFAGIFLVALFAVGKALYSLEAGMLALAIGTFTPYLIWVSRQARYYSAALAIGTLSMLSLCLLVREGRWRHFIVTGLLLILLFHTHVLTFAALTIALGFALPHLLKLPGGLRKVPVLIAIIASGTFPWAWLTGFFDAAKGIPMAYPLLRFPQDLLLYPRKHPEIAVLILGTVGQLLLVMLLGKKLPVRIVDPFRSGRAAMGILTAMLCLSSLLFVFLTPAASFFIARMSLMLIVPAVLLASILLAASARVLSPRNPAMVLAVLLLGGLGVTWKSWFPKPSSDNGRLFEVVNYLRNQNFHAGTRIYAVPYDHLQLTFYTGLPVQSVAPVRKEFLDGYKGDIIMLEQVARYTRIPREVLLRQAREAGEVLGDDAIQKWQLELSVRPALEHLTASVQAVDPPLEPLPAWAEKARAEYPGKPEQSGEVEDWTDGNPAIFRGYHVTDAVRFWPVFFYRFVDPEGRSGPRLNYASRIRLARARVLSSWFVYHCNAPIGHMAVAKLGNASG